MRELLRLWRRIEPWPSGQADPLDDVADCACLHPGLGFPSIERPLGIDPRTFAEVELRRCALCDRHWLQVLIEHEAFSRSGRWHRAMLSEAVRTGAFSAEMAIALLNDSAWHMSGGSGFDGRSQICLPPVFIDVWPAADECRPLYFERH